MEWIPVQKRSLATGIAIGGSAIGAVIAPLMAIYLLDSIGWRMLFLITPTISLVWIGFWLYFNKKNTQFTRFNNSLSQTINMGENTPLSRFEKPECMDIHRHAYVV